MDSELRHHHLHVVDALMQPFASFVSHTTNTTTTSCHSSFKTSSRRLVQDIDTSKLNSRNSEAECSQYCADKSTDIDPSGLLPPPNICEIGACDLANMFIEMSDQRPWTGRQKRTSSSGHLQTRPVGCFDSVVSTHIKIVLH